MEEDDAPQQILHILSRWSPLVHLFLLIMSFFPEEEKSKLPSNHSKSLPKLIKNACAQCHGSCLRTPSTMSSVDESLDSDLDHKQVRSLFILNSSNDISHHVLLSLSLSLISQLIILEIQSRAMKAMSRPREFLFSGKLAWAMSPTTGRVHMTPMRKTDGEEEGDCGGYEEDDDDESEAFFSVKSCFSCCSTDGSTELKEISAGSILEEFRHCEGWPFGLCRRAVVLPPLPRSPLDSWTWHKRNLVSRDFTKSLAMKS